MFIKTFKAFMKRRKESKINTLLDSDVVSLQLIGVEKVLLDFDIELLKSRYDGVKGEKVLIKSSRDPIELLVDTVTFRECLSDNEYLPNNFGTNAITTRTFDDWYGYQDCSIETNAWLPKLSEEVTKLTKVVSGAELCALEEYSYFIRRGGALINELKELARALLALGAE